MVGYETLGSIPSTVKKCWPFWALSGPSEDPLPLRFPDDDFPLGLSTVPTWLIQAGQTLLTFGLAARLNKSLPIYGLLAQLLVLLASV